MHVYLQEKNYRRIAKGIDVDEKTIVFETFMGRQYGCNPRAIYEYMLGDSRFDDFNFIWVLMDPDKAKDIPQSHRIQVVKPKTEEYFRAYAKAKYAVINSNLNYGIEKKDEQIFLQTWHGTPLKRLRCDIEIDQGNALNTLDEIKQKNDLDVSRYDYFLSPSAFASEKFKTAFNLHALGKEDIVVETGYPRNDLLFNFDEDYVAKVKDSLGISGDKKIILYAPTFRDNMHDGGGYTYDTHLDFQSLQQEVGDEYVVLFRAHYFVASQFDFSKYEGFVYDVSKLDDITPLYAISDMLITDYSSVFFDYANLKRPIIYYMYDMEEYATGIRGFYLDLEELPGPIVKTEDDLIKAIKSLALDQESIKGFQDYGEKYDAFNARYNYLDDGHASKRVADILLRS
ncbi:MAG: CDP-glycerol glycerophosphotransferase family protein [Bacillota bacterium]|nr:CDP-glycerol glycerophosphotransferase family protein [Bacillota bacterium]